MIKDSTLKENSKKKELKENVKLTMETEKHIKEL